MGVAESLAWVSGGYGKMFKCVSSSSSRCCPKGIGDTSGSLEEELHMSEVVKWYSDKVAEFGGVSPDLGICQSIFKV